jgi:hypothetical protein
MRNKCTGTHTNPNRQDIGTGAFIRELYAIYPNTQQAH